ncbi:aldose epimerase family protein [Candidatus Clostridium radicumherbarum]|uniref:Aldose 1-epimerase n=1 Tax=Candidatus Clostridium radicumherbarum TaxID=3381662 RepID=A0ABW8TVV2_9CLOT
MSIEKKYFGSMADGIEVYSFILTNSKGTAVEIINFGGIVRSLKLPNDKGSFDDVVLGFDKLEDYMKEGPYFGAIIGRYANRIAKGSFNLNGTEYKLKVNNGSNHLHGGLKGFDKVIWEPRVLESESLELSYISKDMEEGYPGNLEVKVTYTLTDDNSLKIDYFALTDKDTIVNLTNHSYFNLSGHASGNILNHKVYINADKFTAAYKDSIPTGELRGVVGTPMDFTKLKKVGDEINSSYEQIVFAKGYDHNFIINREDESLIKTSEVVDENSGRTMEVYTTMPGVQFYTGNFIEEAVEGPGKEGAKYSNYSGLCLETQFFTNSINIKHFPSPILRAKEEYKHTTIYKFI